MTKVLILGASGQIARWAVQMLGEHKDVEQTLLVRDPRKLSGHEPANAKVVIGDVMDKKLLAQIMKVRTWSMPIWPAKWTCKPSASWPPCSPRASSD